MNEAQTAKTAILSVLGIIGGAITTALGGRDGLLIALAIIMGVDYLTGLAVALIFKKSPKTENGSASSGAAVKGLIKKGAMLLVVVVAAQLTSITGTPFIRDAVITYFIGAEGLSILENGGLMGIKYPAVLRNALEALRDTSDGASTDKNTDDGKDDSNGD